MLAARVVGCTLGLVVSCSVVFAVARPAAACMCREQPPSDARERFVGELIAVEAPARRGDDEARPWVRFRVLLRLSGERWLAPTGALEQRARSEPEDSSCRPSLHPGNLYVVHAFSLGASSEDVGIDGCHVSPLGEGSLAAMRTLGGWAGADVDPAALAAERFAVAVETLAGGSPERQRAALQAIRAAGSRAATVRERLLDLASSSATDVGVRRDALFTVSALVRGDVSVLPRVLPLLGAPEESGLPLTAFLTIQEVGDAAGPALLELLADPREPISARVMAAELIGRMNGPPAGGVAVLVDVLEGEDSSLHREAVAAIGAYGARGAAAVPTLTRWLETARGWDRRVAVGALGAIGPPASESLPLLRTLAAEDPDLTELCVKAIGRIEGRDTRHEAAGP